MSAAIPRRGNMSLASHAPLDPRNPVGVEQMINPLFDFTNNLPTGIYCHVTIHSTFCLDAKSGAKRSSLFETDIHLDRCCCCEWALEL